MRSDSGNPEGRKGDGLGEVERSVEEREEKQHESLSISAPDSSSDSTRPV